MKLWANVRPGGIYIYTHRDLFYFFNVHTHVPIYIMSVGTLLSTELLHTQSIQATLLRWVEVFDRGSMACVDDRILPGDIGQPRRLWFYLLGWLIDSNCGNVFVIFYASAHGELSGNEHPSATRGFVKTRLQHRRKPCKDYLRGLEQFFNRSLSRQRNIAQGQSSHLICSGMMQEVNELPRLRGNGTKWPNAMIGEWDSLGMSGISQNDPNWFQDLVSVCKASPCRRQLQTFQVREAKCFCCSNNHHHPQTGAELICDRELVYEGLKDLYSAKPGTLHADTNGERLREMHIGCIMLPRNPKNMVRTWMDVMILPYFASSF